LLKENCKVLANFFKYFLVFWLLLVIHGFVKTTPGVIADLQEKQYIGGEQEKNVRAYLASEDSSHLQNKPFLHIPYPKADRLKTLLDNKIIRAFLPSNLALPLSPSLVEVSGLVLDTAGYYPTTPNLHMRKTYGTYNSQGNISQGLIRLDFDNKTSSRIYVFLVSGYPTQPGISISVSNALGHTYRIQPDHDPKESWESFYLPIGRGAFSIFLEDRSSSAWVAISSPIPEGRMAAQRKLMLLSNRYFLTFGLVLLVLIYGRFEVYGYEAPRQ